jgi:hypothetical protein
MLSDEREKSGGPAAEQESVGRAHRVDQYTVTLYAVAASGTGW